jgi:two-component system OmpR family sensor kinase
VSLRARLLVGMVALVAAGLAVAAFATYEEQRSFLLTRVDQQVMAALAPFSTQLRLEQAGASGKSPLDPPPRFGFGRRSARRPALLPPGTFGELLGPGGKVLQRRTFSYDGSTSPTLPLPARIPISRIGGKPRLFTITGRGGLRYRAVAVASGRNTAIVAVPLREADQTLHRLVVVDCDRWSESSGSRARSPAATCRAG